MKSIEDMSQLELAAFVHTHLRERGVNVVLSGGAAVSMYSKGRYISLDLDLVNIHSARFGSIRAAMNEIGFEEDRYGFHNLDVKIQDIPVVTDLPFEIESMDVWCYGSNIFELTEPGNGFAIETSCPPSRKVGQSVAYHDEGGWHISQRISDDAIIENISGNGIDTAYVIVTYFFDNTPAGDIDFGIGISEEIELVISDYVHSPTNPSGANSIDTVAMNIVVLVLGGGSITLFVLVSLMYSKKRGQV